MLLAFSWCLVVARFLGCGGWREFFGRKAVLAPAVRLGWEYEDCSLPDT